MKAYMTWGIGYGKTREMAEINAQRDANLEKIRVSKLDKLEIPRYEIVDDRKFLMKLKGEFPGIVLQNCAKSEVASELIFAITEDKMFIGKGKSTSPLKARKLAHHEAEKAAGGEGIESFDGIAAIAPYRKDFYGCAIVALVIVK